MTTKHPKFAEGTAVPVEKSRGELTSLLERHGASGFAVFQVDGGTRVVFTMHSRMVRLEVRHAPLPGTNYKDSSGAMRWLTESQRKQRQEGENRRRWRVLLLVTKGKLEIVDSGESTFEREFLADILLANGETVAEAMLPRIAESYDTGEMPSFLLLGPGHG